MAVGSYLAAKGAGKQDQVKVIGTHGLPGGTCWRHHRRRVKVNGPPRLRIRQERPRLSIWQRRFSSTARRPFRPTVTVSTLAIRLESAKDLNAKLKF